MKIKVYNENGTVKITKILDSGKEMTMFSNLASEEIATIEIQATASMYATKAIKKNKERNKQNL